MPASRFARAPNKGVNIVRALVHVNGFEVEHVAFFFSQLLLKQEGVLPIKFSQASGGAHLVCSDEFRVLVDP